MAEALEVARDTRSLKMVRGALSETPDIFRQQFGDKPAIIVADTNTYAAAGRAVLEALQKAGCSCRDPFIFNEPDLHADHRFVVILEDTLRGHDAIPIAVGSGTINDLAKLASHRAGRPYMVVATAASMDGYTAFGAAITYQGSKQTFTCPAPRAVVADLDLICAAPAGMNAWGFADLLAKVPAGADWIVADALGADPLNPKAWDIVQGGLREALADPAGVRRADPEAVGRLAEGLMLGGFAMQYAQSSRPASGAEHYFSHLWEMQHHTHNGKAPSHGFKVGIGTQAVTALYEYLLRVDVAALDVNACCARWPDDAARQKTVRALFQQDDLLTMALRESGAKWVDAAALHGQLSTLRRAWPALRERLTRQLLPLPELQRRLNAVGAPVQPEEIGITRQRLRETFWQACFIRSRFTILDVAFRCNLLAPALDHVFGPHGPWPITTSNQTHPGQP